MECPVCSLNSRRRKKIDQALGLGVRPKTLAILYNLPEEALEAHRKDHIAAGEPSMPRPLKSWGRE